MVLWTLLFIYIITPYAVQIKLNPDYFTLQKGYLYELIESKVYYSNIFIIQSKLLEDDLEILCDKLVLKRLGETKDYKKEYLESMIKLMENKDETKIGLPLKIPPNFRKDEDYKKYRTSLTGVISLVLLSEGNF